MRYLYLDCGMGAAGDMLTAALLELFPEKEAVVAELNAMGIPGVEFAAETVSKCGITGTHMAVKIHGMEEGEHHHNHHHGEPEHHHHDHSSFPGIIHIISHLNVSPNVAGRIGRVYERIAQAESQVHGMPVTQVHFHEVGAMDAVADVAAVCYLMDKLSVDQVVASPVHVGSGSVRCAHGIMPVPAPATALLLKGVPTYGGEISGELCTPTGAALLREFVSAYGAQPAMKVTAVGYGCGKKDFPRANALRAMLGDTDTGRDAVTELKCNLDDMTGEAIGYALDALLAKGALDVFTTPIGMKKNRPGVLLTVLCREKDAEAMAEAIFANTTTLGVRRTSCDRWVLSRREETVETAYGPVRCKVSTGYGVERVKPEYDDLSAIAGKAGISLEEVRKAFEKARGQ